MAQLGLPTVELLQAIRRIVREDRLRNESNITSRQKRRIPRGGGAGDTWGYGVTSGTVSAAIGTPLTTLGTGNVAIYDDDGLGAVTASGTTEQMWNTMHSVIADEMVVHWVLRANGEYYITAVDCQ